MKKIKIIVLLLLCIIITGCGSKEKKEAGTLSNFESIALSQGFAVNDNMGIYKDANYIIGSMIATKDDITIEMVIYDTNDNAINALDSHIKTFNSYKSATATTKKDKGENYYHYEYISNGYYLVSSRIDNTLIFSKTLLTNKAVVENILNSMNY